MPLPTWTLDLRCCSHGKLISGLYTSLAVQESRNKPYHVQIIPVLKFPVTDLTIVFIVPGILHVSLDGLLRRISVCAGIAFVRVVILLPMTDGIHVLVRRMLSTERLVADLTIRGWRLVVCSIHVLVTGTPGSETTRTCIAFIGVIVATVVRHCKVGFEVARYPL